MDRETLYPCLSLLYICLSIRVYLCQSVSLPFSPLRPPSSLSPLPFFSTHTTRNAYRQIAFFYFQISILLLSASQRTNRLLSGRSLACVCGTTHAHGSDFCRTRKVLCRTFSEANAPLHHTCRQLSVPSLGPCPQGYVSTHSGLVL